MTDERKKRGTCLICGKTSDETVCEACKDRVQAEATHKKRKTDRDKKE